MYTTPDEDRSDIYLAGAVYVFGPQIYAIVMRDVRLPVFAGIVVALLVGVSTTVLVPFLLMRYRKERLSVFGFSGDKGAFLPGVLAALPVAAAFVLGNVIAHNPPLAGVRIFDAIDGSTADELVRIVNGLCIGLLAIYVTVKARTAFRSDPGYIRSTMIYLGRIVGIVAAVAAVLLFVSALTQGVATQSFHLLLAPIGVAAGLWLVYRAVSGSLLTSRATLLAPMVIMAIGSLRLFAPAFDLVFGLWRGAMLAALGLGIAVLMESRRSAWAPLGLVTGLVLLSPLVA
jgi:hypothetical protein